MRLSEATFTNETLPGSILTWVTRNDHGMAEAHIGMANQIISGMVGDMRLVCLDLVTGETQLFDADDAKNIEFHGQPGEFKTVKALRAFIDGWFPGRPLGTREGHGCSLRGSRHYQQPMTFTVSVNHRTIWGMQWLSGEDATKSALLKWANEFFSFEHRIAKPQRELFEKAKALA